MREVVFFDGQEREQLLPLTYLRPSSLCMVGMMTIEDQWHPLHHGNFSHLTPDYLNKLYPYRPQSDKVTFVNGACLPTDDLIGEIMELSYQDVLYNASNHVVAFTCQPKDIRFRSDLLSYIAGLNRKEISADLISYPEDILQLGASRFTHQYKKKTAILESASLDETNRVIGDDLFVGKDTSVTCAIINTTEGPVYIDDRVSILENAIIKGPVYLGPDTRIHVAAQVYPDTFLGPQCRVGGEIKRTTMFGYSNKAHGGYLGDSVLGKWCNLGAATNNSNMKNTYGKVNLWDIHKGEKRKTERQFLGSILGDHTMTAIQTSLNTGTMTGVFACALDRNPPSYLSSFSWGNSKQYDVAKAVEVARHAMSRRGIAMSDAYADVLYHIADER